MPVIRLPREELRKLGMDENLLLENVAMLGADPKGIEGDEILVEFFPDRPDLYTVEGVVRAMKGFLGEELGAPRYVVEKGNIEVQVDGNLENIRPYMVGAVVRNLDIDDSFIKSMMDFQEKLHLTVGRKRKKVAIGLHDFDKVKPPFRYIASSPDFAFEPLGFQERMSLEEILKKHPKGVEYADILKGHTKYPLILDSEDNVLSFPPIINGNLTQITPDTRNIFIDITGTDLNVLRHVLNILVSAFADRGARIESVKMIYPQFVLHTPDMEYRKMSVEKSYIFSLLGMEMSDEELKNSLLRMRYDVEIGSKKLQVTIPPYRMDILHPVDIVEDIAKGYGYGNFTTELPSREVILHRINDRDERIREIMIGLGFLEITTLTISSFKLQYEMMRLPPENYVEIANPISEEGVTLRTWLIPSLMEILRKNKHRELPQKLFEIGYIRKDTMEKHLGWVYIDSEASFTQSKSITEAILRDMGVKEYIIEEKMHPSFIPGRCASVIIDGREIGFFGEVHPEIIENFELSYPVIAMEIKI